MFPTVTGAEDRQRQAEDRRRQAEDQQRQAKERIRRTTFEEFFRACHNLLSLDCRAMQDSEALNEFGLGDGVQFDNHANALGDVYSDMPVEEDQSIFRQPTPDQFCVHRVNRNTNTLLTTVEYKPPHKLSVENLRAGRRPMDFWKEVVQRTTIPTDRDENLTYNAEQLTGSAVVQQYHVMIHQGLEYSCLTNGLALVLLRVRYNDPSTLYYYHANGIWQSVLQMTKAWNNQGHCSGIMPLPDEFSVTCPGTRVAE
ncbi:hypothetical protein V1524DRAFT_301073 [Lipomyces starkeyi]